MVDSEGNYVFIIPIHREFLVAYTNDYDVVRRLRIVTNENGEVIHASIVEIISERNSLQAIEKNLLRNLNYLEVSGFSGIILEYDMSYQLQRSRFWLNGNLVKQGVEISLEQETTGSSQRSGDCYPVYMYVRIPGDCPNTGQPGHTGQMCLVQDTWVRVLAGYDCFLDSVAPTPVDLGGGGANITDPSYGFLSGCCGSLGGDTGSNIGGPRGSYYNIDPNYLPPNFDDPDGIYKAYKKALKDDLDETKSFIQNFGISTMPDLQKIVSYKRIRQEALEKAIIDIAIIEKSTHQYKFISLPPENGRLSGEIYYDVVNNKIVIAFPQSTNGKSYLGLKAHEVHHGAQFETGKLSFNKITGKAGVLYDLQDEVECYSIQYTLQTNEVTYGMVDIELNPSPSFTVNTTTVLALGIYNTLPATQITINTDPQGTNLQNATNPTDIFVKP